MNIVIDTIQIQIFASRERQGQKRHYGTMPEYPDLLLVLQGGTITELHGQKAVLLFNDQMHAPLVCDLFPEAPQRWRETRLIQATVKPVKKFKVFHTPPIPLSEALRLRQKDFKY